MVKFAIVLFALLGFLYLMNTYVPQVWGHGFSAWGQFFPAALFLIAGFAYIAYKRVS